MIAEEAASKPGAGAIPAEAKLNFWQTLAIALIGGALSGYATYLTQERKLKKDFQLQDSAQRVAQSLLSRTEWPLRSFRIIHHHLGGFEDQELRQILVRSGAIRFMSKSGTELWGLVERNKHLLGVTRIDADPAPVDEKSLFS